MKNIIKLFSFLMVFAFISCDSKDYAVPDIQEVPVYSITETGNNSLFKVNVYQNNPLLFIWNNKGAVKELSTSNYTDSSDEMNYSISFTATEKTTETDAEGVTTEVSVNYQYNITGSKETGVGVMSVTTEADGLTTSYDMKIAPDTVYL